MGITFSSKEEDRSFTDKTHDEKVVSHQQMSVPMQSTKGYLSHTGVKVTTESGNQYMVHKTGPREAISGKEVVEKVPEGQSCTEVRSWSTPDSES